MWCFIGGVVPALVLLPAALLFGWAFQIGPFNFRFLAVAGFLGLCLAALFARVDRSLIMGAVIAILLSLGLACALPMGTAYLYYAVNAGAWRGILWGLVLLAPCAVAIHYLLWFFYRLLRQPWLRLPKGMGWKEWTAAVALGAGAIAAGTFGVLHLITRQPTDANLSAAIREELANPTTQDAPARYCLQVPVDSPPPDARSRLRRFGWHADYLKDASAKPGRDKQVAQLDALASVGLLDKQDVELATPDSGRAPATRFSVSAKGWREYSSQAGCFQLGTPSLVQIVDKSEVDRGGQKVQAVRARVAPDRATLPEWATDAKVQAAFPEIAKLLEGGEEDFALHFSGGKWRTFHERGTTKPPIEELPKQEQARMKTLAGWPDARREELVAEISKFPERSCLVLPGSEKLPADKVLQPRKPYRFAIFQDKARPASDPVVAKTVPILGKLLEVGAIVRLPDAKLPGDGADGGNTYNAIVFGLSPALQGLMDSRDDCISLGPLTHEIVALDYRKADRWGYPIASYSFKKIVRLKSPPAALTDPVLLANWPDLQGTLEKGHACEGEFQFSKETRSSEAGGASCWYAFDSYYENY